MGPKDDCLSVIIVLYHIYHTLSYILLTTTSVSCLLALAWPAEENGLEECSLHGFVNVEIKDKCVNQRGLMA